MVNDILQGSIFRPNRIDEPSATKTRAAAAGLDLAPVPPERELKAHAIRLQIRSVQVTDGLGGIWGTTIGAATGVYLITTVIDGTTEQPIAFQGRTYQGIANGAMLPLGQGHEKGAVFNVYLREGQLPRLLTFNLVVFRSNEGIREVAGVFDQICADERYSHLSTIVQTAATAANPVFGAVWQAADALVGLIAEYLKAKPDDQLGYYQANFTNVFDNLGVGRHPADQPTMAVDRIRFAYEINAYAGE